MEDERAIHLLDNWEAETERVLPNITFFPEELSLSVAAWRVGLLPTFPSGDVFCDSQEVRMLNIFQDRPHLEFFIGNL